MAVLTSIIDNIDTNLDLMKKGDTNEHYLEIDSTKAISEMFRNEHQVFIDEANAEAEHGIGVLSLLLLKK